MADDIDIVTRLAEELDSLKADPQVLRDAIDEIGRLRIRCNFVDDENDEMHDDLMRLLREIERLREIAEAADQYHDVACDPDWCRLCRALNAWLEARRD